MNNLFKISAIIGVIVIAVLAIAFALGLAKFPETQDALFRTIAVLAIITVASAFVSFLAKPKK
jgi:hypothetical protein